jgi:DNA repair protein RecO (recombination protein O)
MERTVTLALVARSVEYGDADRVCTLLTHEHGKVSALARSAKRSRKRFGAALALFVLGEATLRASRGGGELWLLERFDGVEDLTAAIGGDVVKLAHGSYLLELTRELWPPGQPEPAGFELLLEGLRALARADRPTASLLRAYELRALGAVGLAPALDRCPVCAAGIADAGSFDLARGGVVCRRCGGHGIALGAEAIERLQALQRVPLGEAAALEAPPPVARTLREVMREVVRHTLGKELRSLEFILKLASGPGAGIGR